ncbi:H-2 class II histocompatibility antigen, E-S beta chain-like [Tenrec ecaudatus]|uniref:H-2 class II histocompatibility antigen, E-S beta chain-like n=1 Tax=Tenrec ecaudatus TaxID=94439 RepID=UPI003F59F2A3
MIDSNKNPLLKNISMEQGQVNQVVFEHKCMNFVDIIDHLFVSVPAAHFLRQAKSECHFTNGTERARFLERHIYNLEEFMRFDSDVGAFVAVTEMGRQDVKHWSPQKDLLDHQRSLVDTLCRANYQGMESFTAQRRVEPVVSVYPAKTQPLQHHNLLVCSVNGFYPGHIEVTWFRNGQEEKAGVVSTGLIQNGDWTFQMLEMLEVTPQSGEVYSCRVEHPSLTSPVTVEWRARSVSAQSKMLSGIGGFVLGLLFLGAELFISLRKQTASSQLHPQSECFSRIRLTPDSVDHHWIVETYRHCIRFPSFFWLGDYNMREREEVAGRLRFGRNHVSLLLRDA